MANLEAREYTENIVEAVRGPLVVLNSSQRVIFANKSFYRTFMVSKEETEGRFIYELWNHQWDIPKLRELLEDILPKKNVMDDFEVEHIFDSIGKRTMLLNARQVIRKEEGLKEKNKKLERFRKIMVGRELDMIKLKKDVNDLLEKFRQPKKYDVLYEKVK